MKINLVLVVLVTLLFGCTEESKDDLQQNACTASNPMQVEWLSQIKDSLQDCSCEISIIQGTYEGETVYFVALTDALCDGISTPTLFDCKGNAIRTFTDNDYQDFNNEVSRDTVLYRCNNQ